MARAGNAAAGESRPCSGPAPGAGPAHLHASCGLAPPLLPRPLRAGPPSPPARGSRPSSRGPAPLAWPSPPLLPPLFLRAGLAALCTLSRTLTPASAPIAAMSTGTFVVSQPLNYRGGARVEPVDASGTEKAFEPATGNGVGGKLRGPG